MDLSESSQSALEVPPPLILCMSFFVFSTFFRFTVPNFSVNTECSHKLVWLAEWFMLFKDQSTNDKCWLPNLGKRFTSPPRKTFLLIMDNTAKVTEMIHAAIGDHSNYQHTEYGERKNTSRSMHAHELLYEWAKQAAAPNEQWQRLKAWRQHKCSLEVA